ncbi:MAG: ketosteroid isomerase [Sulfuriferula multivorans]|uniref:Ketosteroid isomerase n=1 Tax=Sulfuriferula multivorans TaxID=1559896 RepID=A0A7C9P2S6_9PROT|nr:ketosteroid isomerase [Sulfuriferula multivorans]
MSAPWAETASLSKSSYTVQFTDSQDNVLTNHLPDVVIYDVLPPMKYESAESYRRSWGEWQPDAQGEVQFELQDLSVTAGAEVAFAHCFVKCGGTLPDGKTFEDLVRATFCFRKASGSWKVAHQHISKPFQSDGPDRENAVAYPVPSSDRHSV